MKLYRHFFTLLCIPFFAILIATCNLPKGFAGENRPNILWVIVEDMSPHFHCFGEESIETPNVDRLAKEGIQFRKAFVTAPICSISRSALITGRYQTSIGAQNHRSSVPGHEIHLPGDAPLIPALMKQAGYHVNNLTLQDFLKDAKQLQESERVPVAKTDYNFEWDEASCYDATHWAKREQGKPFFVQVQLNGGKYRGNVPRPQWPERVKKELGSVTSTTQFKLPPYLPQSPAVLNDWAQYLDTVRFTDWELGQILKRLDATNERSNTVIFFMTDHGISHVRNKQFLYDGGTHVPLVIQGPGVDSGEIRDDLVEHIDLGATSLALAGINRPETMHSQDILSNAYTKRKYVYAARDRADETVDLIRSVRSDRYKYIYNGFPNRPYLQPNNYKDNKSIVQEMRQLFADGKLNTQQAAIMSETRPREELYDLESDPWESKNLAQNQGSKTVLEEMRAAFRDWQVRTGDPGKPESEDVYRIEAAAPHAEGGKNTENVQYQKNVELMIQWNKEKPFVP